MQLLQTIFIFLLFAVYHPYSFHLPPPPTPLNNIRVLEKKIKLLQGAYKKKLVVGGFFSMHIQGVGTGHNSLECTGKKNEGNPSGQDNSTTCSKSIGLGKDHNKCWDD